jgi:hypothetical protein
LSEKFDTLFPRRFSACTRDRVQLRVQKQRKNLNLNVLKLNCRLLYVTYRFSHDVSDRVLVIAIDGNERKALRNRDVLMEARSACRIEMHLGGKKPFGYLVCNR